MTEPKSRRRLAKNPEALTYGHISRTALYERLKDGSVRAFKRGGQTLVDLDSIDRMHAELPAYVPRQMRQ